MVDRGRIRTYPIPIKPLRPGDKVTIRHWSGHHQWEATLLEVNSDWAILDLGYLQGTVQLRIRNTKKFLAGTFTKGMKGWSVDIGQLERLREAGKLSKAKTKATIAALSGRRRITNKDA